MPPNPNPKPRAEVVPLRPLPLLDPIFFHKSQIRVGTELEYWGRTAPQSRWRVARITSYSKTRSGSFRSKWVEVVEHLSDDLDLVFVGALREIPPKLLVPRKVSFGYLSYSAIWRLAS